MSKRDPLEIRAELDSVIEVNEVQQQFQGEQLKDVKILSEFLTSNNKMKLAQLEAMRDNMRGIQLEMGEKDLDINFLETRTTEVKHNIYQCRVVIDREKMENEQNADITDAVWKKLKKYDELLTAQAKIDAELEAIAAARTNNATSYVIIKVVFKDQICHFKLFPNDTFEDLRLICASYWHYLVTAPEILFMDGKARIYPWNLSVVEEMARATDDNSKKIKLVTMADVEEEQARKWKLLRGAYDSPDEEAEVPSDEEPNVTGKEAKEYQKKKRAPSVPTEMNAEEEIVAIIKGNSFKIVNLFMYIVFMVIFVLNLQFRKNTYTEFGITNAVHGSIIHTEFQHSPNNFLLFKDLKNEDEFWTWAETVLANGLFSTRGDFAVARSNRVIGGVRFGTWRVKKNTCSFVDRYVALSPQQTVCYDDYWDADSLSLNPSACYDAGCTPGTRWKRATLSTAVGMSGIGYDEAAFVYDFDIDADDAAATRTQFLTMLTQLRNESAIDTQTRALLIRFNLMNLNTGYFVSTDLLVEFNGGGQMFTKYVTAIMTMSSYFENIGPLEVTRMICDAFVYVFTFYTFCLSVYQVILYGVNAFLSDVWNLVHLCLIASQIFVALLRVSTIFDSTRASLFSGDGKLVTGNAYINLAGLQSVQSTIFSLESLNCLLICMGLFKFFAFSDQVNLVWETAIAKSTHGDLKMWPFVFVGLMIFFAYSCVANQIFGVGVYEYHSLSHALGSLTRAMLGDFEYDPLIEWSPHLGQTFFMFFLLTTSFVGVKVALAIMNDSFMVANDKNLADFAFQVENGGTLWMRYQNVLKERNIIKEGKNLRAYGAKKFFDERTERARQAAEIAKEMEEESARRMAEKEGAGQDTQFDV